MKKLKTLAIVKEGSDITTLTSIERSFSGMVLSIETNIENTIEHMSRKDFDLLLIDKNLLPESYQKLNKLSEILFPHAAVVNVHIQDEDFLRFKLSGLLSKWSDSQTDARINFLDNPIT